MLELGSVNVYMGVCVCLYVGVFRYLFCILVGKHEPLVFLKLHTQAHTSTHTQTLCPGCGDVVMMY